MRIAIFETEPWEHESFESLSSAHEVEFTEEPLTTQNVQRYPGADVVSTFIYSDLGSEVLSKLESLELVATRSTGYDHVDLDVCRERAITVCNVPNYGSNTVAEHVFALLLALGHRLVDAVDRTRRGDFSLTGLRGFDLRGKILGVVGTGDIGRCVVEIARGFRMEVLAYDIEPDDGFAEEFGFDYVSMDELLGESDVVTLHVPLNPQTHHMMSDQAFEQMKPGAVLINTARGGLVHTKALLQALSTGRVAAAGLDVLPEEPVIREEAELLRSMFREEHNLEDILADHVLLRMRNVIITPHSAFNTREAVGRILQTTVENIAAYADGSPRNVVG